MGSCVRSFHARIPLPLGSGPADHQGRHHAGCSGGDSRRLGQDLVVAQFNSERASEITLHWYILSEALTGHTYESSGSTYAAPRREPDFLRCTEVIPPAAKLT